MNDTRSIWIVVAVLVLAFLAFLFYRTNTPEEVVETGQQVATSTAETATIAAARTQAAADLTALRVRQEAGETYASLEDEYADVRVNLAATYANAGAEAKEEWAEVNADFDAFEASARAGTSDVLSTLATLINRLAGDVGTENPGE